MECAKCNEKKGDEEIVANEEEKFKAWLETINAEARRDYVMLGPMGMVSFARKAWLAGRVDLIDELKVRGI
jgi:hypothetical protein